MAGRPGPAPPDSESLGRYRGAVRAFGGPDLQACSCVRSLAGAFAAGPVLRVAENPVGLCDLPESPRGIRIAGVSVGVRSVG